MTSDPIPHARESAVEVLRAGREAGEQFATNTVQRKLYGDIAEAGAKAALATPSGDDVADLQAKLARKEEWNRLRAEDIVTLGRQVAAEAHRDALQERVRVLEEALRPFAAFANSFAHREDASVVWISTDRSKDSNWIGWRADVFRRARAALTPHQQGNGGDDA